MYCIGIWKEGREYRIAAYDTKEMYLVFVRVVLPMLKRIDGYWVEKLSRDDCW